MKSFLEFIFENNFYETYPKELSSEDIIKYISKHHKENLHQDYIDYLNTFKKFVLKDIDLDEIETNLPALDKSKVEEYKKMNFNQAPPIVVAEKYILDGYHRTNVAKFLGLKTIKGYVGINKTD